MLVVTKVLMIVFAILSAIFWWRAATSKVYASSRRQQPEGLDYEMDASGAVTAWGKDGKAYAPISTLVRQERANTYAAIFAAIAAVAQAADSLLGWWLGKN